MKKLNHKLIMLLAPFAIMAGISTTTIAHADSGWDSPVQNGGYISAPGVTITDAQKAEMNAETIAGQKAADEAVKAGAKADADYFASVIAEDKAKGINPNTDDRLPQGGGIDFNHYNPYTDANKYKYQPVDNVPAKTTTKKTAKKTVKKVVAKKKATKKTVVKKTVKKVHTIKTVKKIYAYKTTNTKNHVGRKAIKKGTKYHVVKTVKVGNKKMYEIKGHRFVTANAKYVLIVR